MAVIIEREQPNPFVLGGLSFLSGLMQGQAAARQKQQAFEQERQLQQEQYGAQLNLQKQLADYRAHLDLKQFKEESDYTFRSGLDRIEQSTILAPNEKDVARRQWYRQNNLLAPEEKQLEEQRLIALIKETYPADADRQEEAIEQVFGIRKQERAGGPGDYRVITTPAGKVRRMNLLTGEIQDVIDPETGEPLLESRPPTIEKIGDKAYFVEQDPDGKWGLRPAIAEPEAELPPAARPSAIESMDSKTLLGIMGQVRKDLTVVPGRPPSDAELRAGVLQEIALLDEIVRVPARRREAEAEAAAEAAGRRATVEEGGRMPEARPLARPLVPGAAPGVLSPEQKQYLMTNIPEREGPFTPIPRDLAMYVMDLAHGDKELAERIANSMGYTGEK